MAEIFCVAWIIGALIGVFVVFIISRYDHIVKNEKFNDYEGAYLGVTFWPVVLFGLPIFLSITGLSWLIVKLADKMIVYFFQKEKTEEKTVKTKEKIEPSYREAATCDECGR